MSNPDLTGDFFAIILGASEWPQSTRLPSSSAFWHSAADFKRYLLSPIGLGIKPNNLLDLFNDPRAVGDIDYEIERFLSEAVARLGAEIKNLIIFYTGHGAFVEGEQKYCLTVQSTRLGALGTSGYRISSLARTLNRTAPEARKFVIIDACYAGAAQSDFVPQSDAATRMEEQTIGGLADSGTALLCAASSADVALAPIASSYTMFSEAVLTALRQGSIGRGTWLSFDDLRDLAGQLIRQKYRDLTVQPEIHIPDQRRGDLSKVRFLPNPALRGEVDKKRKIGGLRARYADVASRLIRTTENLAKYRNSNWLWIVTGLISGIISYFTYNLQSVCVTPVITEDDTLMLTAPALQYASLVDWGLWGPFLCGYLIRFLPGVIFGIALAFCVFIFRTRRKTILVLVILITTMGWYVAVQVAAGTAIALGGYSRISTSPYVVDDDTADSADSSTPENSQPVEKKREYLIYTTSLAGVAGGCVGGMSVVLAMVLTNKRFRRLECCALTLLVATIAGALLQPPYGEINRFNSLPAAPSTLLLFLVWQPAVLRSVSYSLSREVGLA